MKQYKVIVNGTEYEVFAELIGDDGKAAAPAAAPAPVQAPAAAPAPAVSGDGEAVKAPLTGTILAVNINAGDTVAKGDVIMILEAMKMENEIVAPRDGRVTGVSVSKGAAVDAGDTLYTLA
jgi:biotin carboxyl carrier protein